MTSFLLLFLIVLGINLLPALGPPTWSIVVFYGLNSDLPMASVVIVSALAAALGRLLLAYGFRFLGGRLPEKQKCNLGAAREALEARPRNMILGLGLFALSPLPSAQLFAAAGLAKVRLVHFTAAFFAGRLVSYSIYAATAKGLRGTSLGDSFADTLKSPWGIALQIGMIGAVILLTQIDWSRLLGKDHDQAPPPNDAGKRPWALALFGLCLLGLGISIWPYLIPAEPIPLPDEVGAAFTDGVGFLPPLMTIPGIGFPAVEADCALAGNATGRLARIAKLANSVIVFGIIRSLAQRFYSGTCDAQEYAVRTDRMMNRIHVRAWIDYSAPSR